MFAFNLNDKQFYLTLSGATTMGQSGPGSDGNEGILHIPQSSSITEASPSCLMSHPGHLLGVESYPFFGGCDAEGPTQEDLLIKGKIIKIYFWKEESKHYNKK